ncbi:MULTISPECIES: tetratricopeptide repeat protein [unclassified Janthinobacterium]|uniref:tetratricopeptide repeat protein n=1 Tax=unclassified Janthinobacterium TaxID=2610881 RepID=UPI0018CA70B3|nr:tetratricopeptide repeat protein [Janthinobacterium sp. CG_23.4]MDH6158429.1 tetratricopeptide (TPR) repeat protein [Janthinobacterium sp. CG_23.4]
MSLLMQALKKAERAKQNSLSDEELEKPSEAYDQVLELAPADAVAPRAMPAAPPVQMASTLSLEALPESPAPPPQPSSTQPASAQPASPPDPQAGAQAGAQQSTRPEPPPARPRASRSNTPPKGPTGPISVDPATVRLAILLAMLLLVAGSMAYWYWRASTNPGASANLPGVPMPLTDAPGASGVAGPIVVLPATPAAPPDTQPSGATLAPDYPRDARQAAGAAEQQAMNQQAMIQAAAQAAVAAQLARTAPPAPPSLPPVAAPDNSQIQVQRSVAAPHINPGVQQAYLAFNGGQLGLARQQYETVLRQDANNRDALLGLAAVALRENQGAQAASLYLRLLEINPDDGEALGGLIGLRQGDVVQSEAKLKAILARSPDSAPVLFALGNVYAKQRRWYEAQQQFFRAYGAAPGNPDYAFNLAVGLDRLNQPRLAATYYQRALDLAQATPAAFDRTVLQARLRDLAGATPAVGANAANQADPAIIITRQE